jgi:ElaB/YqjD/DUF883 family membrane-anchored ribosome-binding protein
MNSPKTPALDALMNSDDLARQFADLRADVSKLMSTVTGDVADGLEQAGRRIERTSRDARATASSTVMDHPLAAVGIAVGIGLLLGLVARRV